jgi:hypothetical protein
MSIETINMIFVYHDYWAENHRPYRNLLYREDKLFSEMSKFSNSFEEIGVNDGDEVIISITKTGNRPHGDRRIILQEPHTYGFETDEQMKDRMNVEIK